MGITLTKGGNTAIDPDVKRVRVCAGWDVRQTTGHDHDLDLSAIQTDDNKKTLEEQGFVFFNNLKSADGSVVHNGDNLTGAGDGDDEVIEVDLQQVRADVDAIVFVVSIHDAEARGQSFGQVRNAFIRVVDDDTKQEILRYDLTEDASTETVMIFGELYRRDGQWKFRAVGQGYDKGFQALVENYGLIVD
jgi:tellurium resistance protein TerD